MKEVVIFVFEANKESKSDDIYVSRYIKDFYDINSLKIEKIFAGSKTKISSEKTLRLITLTKNKYIKLRPDTIFSVVLFVDVDTGSADDVARNNSMISFASNNNFHLVWFNKTIEDVFLKECIKSDKKNRAKHFANAVSIDFSKFVLNCNANNFPSRQSSNLKTILDTILCKKDS